MKYFHTWSDLCANASDKDTFISLLDAMAVFMARIFLILLLIGYIATLSMPSWWFYGLIIGDFIVRYKGKRYRN